VLGSGKEGAPSLGMRIDSGRPVINRTSHELLEFPMKISFKSPRRDPMKFFIPITLSWCEKV